MTNSLPDVETQAILALCHHQDGPYRPWCPQCVFRSQAAIEHLTVTIKNVIDSL